MDIRDSFPSKWLSASDFDEDADTTLTIRRVENDVIQDADGSKKDKAVVYFKEFDKGLVLNKTNANNLMGLFGHETEDWRGKKVKVGVSEVEFGGKTVPAVRIRIKKLEQNGETAKAKPKPDDDTDPFASDD